MKKSQTGLGGVSPSDLIVNLTLLSLVPGVASIWCYTCEDMASNHMCVSEFNLEECDSNRFDTCQTIVAYSDVSEKLSITKSCATNTSCFLQKIGTPKTPCILTNPVWVCTTCCHSDGCNYSNSNDVFKRSASVLLPAILATLFNLKFSALFFEL